LPSKGHADKSAVDSQNLAVCFADKIVKIFEVTGLKAVRTMSWHQSGEESYQEDAIGSEED
jgi:hypothetical protein